MARRRFLIGLLMLAVILGAAGLVGYHYIDAREELLARADDNLGHIARDAATRPTRASIVTIRPLRSGAFSASPARPWPSPPRSAA